MLASSAKVNVPTDEASDCNRLEAEEATEEANGETTVLIAFTPDATAFIINQATSGTDKSPAVGTLLTTLLIKHRLTFEV
mmetsp:Transcript_21618/g.32578  ORF Transcript_21618/g.32578 Transcript_21618/m.32578 type:complete len:80 (-) Transcript_21618:866-1105(-)